MRKTIDELRASLKAAEQTIAALKSALDSKQHICEMLAQDVEKAEAANAALAEQVERMRAALKAKADRAYCDSLKQAKTVLCLGTDYKLAHGVFTVANLAAHAKSDELMGKHRAYADALTMSEVLSSSPPAELARLEKAVVEAAGELVESMDPESREKCLAALKALADGPRDPRDPHNYE